MRGGEGRSKRGLFHFLMSELIPIRFSLSHTVHHIHVTLKWMNEIANNCTMYTVWTENAYGFGHHILCATLTDKTCARCLAAVRPICLFIYFLLLLSLLDIYPIAPVCGKYDFFFFASSSFTLSQFRSINTIDCGLPHISSYCHACTQCEASVN